MSLQPGDLQDLVLPLLDIDSYNSKIDNQRAIVVAFQVTDQDPAYDLMKFIEGSNLSLLDTEVSPAPSPEGYYIVFVEIARNEKFLEVLTELLEQVDNICDNDWQVKIYPHEQIVEFDPEKLKDLVITDPNQIPAEETETTASPEPTEPPPVMKEDFWQHADINHVVISEGTCVLSGQGHVLAWKIQHPDRKLGKLLLDESLDSRRLKTLLGPDYVVYNYENGLVVQHQGQQHILQPA